MTALCGMIAFSAVVLVALLYLGLIQMLVGMIVEFIKYLLK